MYVCHYIANSSHRSLGYFAWGMFEIAKPWSISVILLRPYCLPLVFWETSVKCSAGCFAAEPNVMWSLRVDSWHKPQLLVLFSFFRGQYGTRLSHTCSLSMCTTQPCKGDGAGWGLSKRISAFELSCLPFTQGVVPASPGRLCISQG